MFSFVVFFQAEDGIRYLVRSRGLGDVYKRQVPGRNDHDHAGRVPGDVVRVAARLEVGVPQGLGLSLIHI